MAQRGGEGLMSIGEVTQNWGTYRNAAIAVDHTLTQGLGGIMKRVEEGRPGTYYPIYEVPIWSLMRRRTVDVKILPRQYFVKGLEFPTINFQDFDPEARVRVMKADLKHAVRRTERKRAGVLKTVVRRGR